MKILVTGSAGFLGSHIVEHLSKDHDVWGVDSLISGSVENIINQYKHITADTSDFVAMKRIIDKLQPDIIYHCACTPYEGFSVFAPSVVTHNTLDNSVAIMSAAANAGVKRFIFMSSMSRYGKQQTPFTEDMEPKPEDPYAVAKVAAEKILEQLAETHGMEYVIAVPHNIIGVRQKYDDPYRNVVSIMINRNLQNLPAIIYGDGEQTRCFSYIDDVMYSLLRMIDCPSGEVYNIGPDDKDGEVVTINELARIVAEVQGFNGEPIHYDPRPREVKHAFTSSDKIRREFGYVTKTSLYDAVLDMTNDILKRGTRPFNYDFLDLEIVNKSTPKTWLRREL